MADTKCNPPRSLEDCTHLLLSYWVQDISAMKFVRLWRLTLKSMHECNGETMPKFYMTFHSEFEDWMMQKERQQVVMVINSTDT